MIRFVFIFFRHARSLRTVRNSDTAACLLHFCKIFGLPILLPFLTMNIPPLVVLSIGLLRNME